MKRNFSIAIAVLLSTSFVFVIANNASPSIASLGTDLNWRNGGHDASNSLCLLLRFHGVEIAHEKCHNHLIYLAGKNEVSLLNVRDAACQLGLKCDVKKTNPEELKVMNLPAIVHLDSLAGKTGIGRFSVVMTAGNGQSIALIEGDSAVVVDAPMDEFRRSWSGFVIIPKPNGIANVFRVFVVVAGVYLILVSLISRFANRGNSNAIAD